jgi:hypothetical protein
MNNAMMDMEDFLSVLDRAENGPIIDVEEWDNLYIYKTIRELIRKYDVVLDMQNLGVSFDDALADRVFEAGMELARQSGVYCINSQRRMIWTQNELDRVLSALPGVVHFGEGTEALTIKKRLPDDNTPVVIGGGPWGIVVPEDLFLPLTKSYIQEKTTDFFCTASLKSVYGRPIRKHSVSDMMACWKEILLTFEAMKEVDRLGMAIAGPNSSGSPIGSISTRTYGALRPSDWGGASFISELKVESDAFLGLCHDLNIHSFKHSFYNSIYGGYAGGAEGVAIATVAAGILMRASLFADEFGPGPSHAHLSCNTFPALIAAQAVAFQALSRNTKIITSNFTRPMAGPGQKELLYEIAALQIATVPSGVAIAKGVQTATGRFESHCSPLEVRFMTKVAHAAEGLTRKEADPIVRKLITKFRDSLKEQKVGKPFNEVYDIEKLCPTSEWQSVYEKVCEQMAELGLPLS